jgi:rod shape-determining protein MreC
VGELLARYRGVLAVAGLILLPLILLYAQTRDPSRRGPVVGVVVDLAGGIERGMLALTGGISDLLQKYVTSVGSQEELIALRRDVMARELLEARVRELELENIDLRQLAGAAASLRGPRPIAARVIGRTGEPLSRIARIDRGRRDGVRRGDGVISSVGVVGRVLSAGTFSSDVLLLTDPGSAIDVVVQRTRARGLVRGEGDDDRYVAKVEDFDRLAEVKAGDVLVTSGLDSHLPAGLHVGKVESVTTRDDGLYKRAELFPAAELSTVERVLVLIRRDEPPPPDVGGDPPSTVVCPDPYAPEPTDAGVPDDEELPSPAPRKRQVTPPPAPKPPTPAATKPDAPTPASPKPSTRATPQPSMAAPSLTTPSPTKPSPTTPSPTKPSPTKPSPTKPSTTPPAKKPSTTPPAKKPSTVGKAPATTGPIP